VKQEHPDWAELLGTAFSTAKMSVSRIASSGERATIVGKGAAGDETILADKVAEDSILSVLLRVRDVSVLSEEAGSLGDTHGRLTAVLDPLDGSANFERGIPFYCTSIAIADGPTVQDVFFGIVGNLVTGDTYIAEKGKGATKNGKPIKTSPTQELCESVAAIDMSRGSAQLLESLQSLVSNVRRQVHYGANALELCYLAEGRFDVFVDIRRRMRITDFAAGYLIAAEAGASITDAKGRRLFCRLDLTDKVECVASANPMLHEEILKQIGPEPSPHSVI